MVYLKVFSEHLLGATSKNHRNCRLRMKAWTPQMQSGMLITRLWNLVRSGWWMLYTNPWRYYWMQVAEKDIVSD